MTGDDVSSTAVSGALTRLVQLSASAMVSKPALPVGRAAAGTIFAKFAAILKNVVFALVPAMRLWSPVNSKLAFTYTLPLPVFELIEP